MQIVENTIIAFIGLSYDMESLERVLWISKDRSEVVLINIDDKDNINFPYFRAFSELEGQLNDGSARILQYDPDLRLLAPDEIYLQKHAASRV